jgi:hypothetical protein
MDIKTLNIVLAQYKKELEKKSCNDAAFMVHFSREDDKYYGFHCGLDTLDIGLVIDQFFTRLSMAIQDAPGAPAFIHYGLAKDIRDKCDKIMKEIEDAADAELPEYIEEKQVEYLNLMIAERNIKPQLFQEWLLRKDVKDGLIENIPVKMLDEVVARIKKNDEIVHLTKELGL